MTKNYNIHTLQFNNNHINKIANTFKKKLHRIFAMLKHKSYMLKNCKHIAINCMCSRFKIKIKKHFVIWKLYNRKHHQ